MFVLKSKLGIMYFDSGKCVRIFSASSLLVVVLSYENLLQKIFLFFSNLISNGHHFQKNLFLLEYLFLRLLKF